MEREERKVIRNEFSVPIQVLCLIIQDGRQRK